MSKKELLSKIDKNITELLERIKLDVLVYSLFFIRDVILNDLDINTQDTNGRTLLVHCYCWGTIMDECHFELLKCEEIDLNLNLQNRDGKTILHEAIKLKDIEFVNALLDYKK